MPLKDRTGIRLAVAFVVSLALHVALGPFVRHVPEARADDGPFVIDIATSRPIVRATPPPAPRPTSTPKPQPVRPRSAQPAVRVPRHARLDAPHLVAARAPHVFGARSGPADGPATAPAASEMVVGDGDAGAPVSAEAEAETPAPPLATTAPVPSATPKPSCARPQVPAHVVVAAEPAMPEIARDRGATGTASIRVDLTEAGAVRDVTIARSAGDPALDAAALVAARQSTYAAEIDDCTPQPGAYLFRVEFDAG